MKTVHPITDQLEPEALDPDQIISGDPKTYVLVLAKSGDGSEKAGLWRCTPGVVTDTEVREESLIITGRATVEFEDRDPVTVGPGDVLTFHGGEHTVWTVEETLLKAYWLKE